MNIILEDLPEMKLVSLDCTGPEQLTPAYRSISSWAEQAGILTEESKMLTIYKDSFTDTEEANVRLSASILCEGFDYLPEKFYRRTVGGGKHVKGHFVLDLEEFEKAWTLMYQWMNDQGYRPSGKDPFEVYHNNLLENPDQKAIVDLYIPVVKK